MERVQKNAEGAKEVGGKEAGSRRQVGGGGAVELNCTY